MRSKSLRLCIWCGPAMVVIALASFVFIARFIPPPPPMADPEQLLRTFETRGTPIRLGLVLMMMASALLVPWSAALCAYMCRLEESWPVLAFTQLASGAAASIEFTVSIMVWQGAVYRPTHSRIAIVSALNDMGWLMFVGYISAVLIQVVSLGLAILMNPRDNPLLPRWLGYFSIWATLLLTPAGLCPLFKSGPLAWNGLIALWVPLGTYCLWLLITTAVMLNRGQRENSAAAPDNSA
jgi:hypothetical protein